jgi:hypothetical protein
MRSRPISAALPVDHALSFSALVLLAVLIVSAPTFVGIRTDAGPQKQDESRAPVK